MVPATRPSSSNAGSVILIACPTNPAVRFLPRHYAVSVTQRISPLARRARWGVILLFWLNGAAWSSIVPRYPEFKDRVGLDDQWWGLVIVLAPLGGLAAGLVTAALIRRYSSATVAIVTQVIGIATLSIIGNAPVAAVLALGIFLMSSCDALTDIAMNAHGLRVHKLYGRPILNSFHGWWSIGAVCGGLLGSAAKQAGGTGVDDGGAVGSGVDDDELVKAGLAAINPKAKGARSIEVALR